MTTILFLAWVIDNDYFMGFTVRLPLKQSLIKYKNNYNEIE